MRRTYKTPNNAEDQQGQYGVSKVSMPLHSITTKIGTNDAANNAEHQKPVKEAKRQIPNTNDFLHVLRIRQNNYFYLICGKSFWIIFNPARKAS